MAAWEWLCFAFGCYLIDGGLRVNGLVGDRTSGRDVLHLVYHE